MQNQSIKGNEGNWLGEIKGMQQKSIYNIFLKFCYEDMSLFLFIHISFREFVYAQNFHNNKN